MPFRKLISKELSDLLKALAHPHRLQIVEELNVGELDVNTLQEVLGISHSNVSQHLAVLRAHRIVAERREGRSVFYHLKHPELAAWLLDGLSFLTEEQSRVDEIRQALDSARAVWTAQANSTDGNGKKAAVK